ncbi:MULTISPECIES: phosphotransferase [Legionella]|uniref:phosphotransferase n=1 Tax=Legionella TaxID=445 RepID=UPI000F8F40B3|nr:MULTISPECIES: phosphotransferase [Legionella]MCP0912901.1 phosphotransferase [Legionella sp. 27cVA30]RUR10057.1 hypothetical protein ELY14_06740 [Legionella septentrionalis]
MNVDRAIPNEHIIASVISSMTGEKVLSSIRMPTGDQNFVYAAKTLKAEYVLRMTDCSNKYKFQAAIAWQKMLLPLGIPLAKFIRWDLDSEYSPFPALLMMRLPGDDLVNVYPALTNANKKNLANEMAYIQSLCNRLPKGPGYGILNTYDDIISEKSWYDFLSKRLEIYKKHITKSAVFNPQLATLVLNIANEMKGILETIQPMPFLWDASERNVLVHNGKITGIVDVDEICFGDSLLVIALTSTCLELEGYDTKYTEYWAETLNLDHTAQSRLDFYRLFYAIAFMRKHSMQTPNCKHVIFDTNQLLNIFHLSLERMKKYGY